ncbi:hypothetical protein TIFTF001_031689 [Ficus carica]|uniref:Uncharacterized protein n=1 Tax=Ficus carica TaxID=3494 RepID=A0AA88DX05_FICCA|nr:hypothetical protein TIFTF001_031689 [Ficus carica]
MERVAVVGEIKHRLFDWPDLVSTIVTSCKMRRRGSKLPSRLSGNLGARSDPLVLLQVGEDLLDIVSQGIILGIDQGRNHRPESLDVKIDTQIRVRAMSPSTIRRAVKFLVSNTN